MPNMISLSDINTYSGMNTSYSSPAVVDTLGPHRLDTMLHDVYTERGNFWQQEQSMLHTQAHNATEYFSGTNGITGPRMPGATGDMNGASRALYWQREDDGSWAHAQVRVNDQIRDSYVHTLMDRFLTEGFTLCHRMTFLWPPVLLLMIYPTEITTLNLQKWIQKNHAPVSRIKCVPGTDRRNFDDLVRVLRNCGGVCLRILQQSTFSRLDSTRLQGGRLEATVRRDFSSRRLAQIYSV
jgi:hypothetical protein